MRPKQKIREEKDKKKEVKIYCSRVGLCNLSLFGCGNLGRLVGRRAVPPQ